MAVANIVEVVKVEKNKRGKGDYLELVYKHLKGNYAGQEWKIGNFTTALSEPVRALLLSSKAGDQVELETKKEGGFWNLASVTKAKEILPTLVNPNVRLGGNPNIVVATVTKPTYDQTGVKVGASRNQAIAFLAATKGTKFTLDDVDKVAYEIVDRQARQEDNVRLGVNPNSAPDSLSKSKDETLEDLDDDLEY